MVEPGNALDHADREPTRAGRDVASATSWLSASEAARRLGINERTIRRAIARRELSATKTAGVYQVSEEALAQYHRTLVKKTSSGKAAPAPPHLIPLRSVRPATLRLAPPPIPLNPLIGRERELATVKALLREPAVRLVTLTGPGGVGKTRLALALATELSAEFADGVGFVDLASVRSPALVGSAIAQSVGVRELGHHLLQRGIAKQLGHRQVLVVLDNFEHVLAAASLVTRLLTACPRLVILATSRAPLQLDGERVHHVSPLPVTVAGRATSPRAVQTGVETGPAALAPPDVPVEAEAVRLFVDRAAAVREEFALTEANAADVSEICRRLDGLPLAIELAAARCAVLSPAMLLARLDDRLAMLTLGRRDVPARMRSLREAISWSHDLLTRPEQALFRRLAVFAGGFTLEAAEYVGGSLRSPSVLDLLTSLVTQNLLVRQDQLDGAVRFVMLETVREFALDCLANSEEEADARRRHLEHFVGLAERTDRLMPRPDRWWEPFELEWANLLAALAWSVEAGQPGLGLRLGGSLFGYWMLRGQVGEGIAWLEQLLAAAADEPLLVKGRGAVALGSLHWIAGDLDRAEALAADGRSLGAGAGDVIGVALALFLQGMLVEARGDLRGAINVFAEARDHYASANQRVAALAVTAHAGRIAGRLGELEVARTQLNEAIPVLDRDDGELWGAATAYGSLGLIVASEGDLIQGAVLVEKALRLHALLGDRLATIITMTNAAQILAMAGRAEAATLLGVADMMRHEAGPSVWTVAQPTHEQATELTRTLVAGPNFEAAFAAGQRLSTEQALAWARAALAVIAPEAKSSIPARDARPCSLSPREQAVMQMVAAGHTDQEVARELGLQARTINAYVASARRKLGVASRAAAAAEIVRRGLT